MITFVSDNIEDSCNEQWDGRDSQGRLYGKGDGETFSIWSPEKKGYIDVDKAKCAEITKQVGIRWKITLTLSFIIPAIKGVFGMWRFQTSGDSSSIPQIRNTFDKMLETAGTVCNIPFDLTVKKVKSQKPGSISQFPVVSLVPNISQDNVEILRNMVQSGQRLSFGLLTDDKFNQFKALPPAPQEVQQIAEPTVEEQITEAEIVEESPDPVDENGRLLLFDEEGNRL